MPSRSGAAGRPGAQAPDFCAIDFGTSNSAVAVPAGDGSMRLVPLEGEAVTLPTAVFYLAEGPGLEALPRRFGRAALAAYVEGIDGRLMRSMKSVLGSSLIDQRTDIGAGRAVSFGAVVASYLRHLKEQTEAWSGRPLRRLVLGRPVYFVDDDPERDRRAEADLADAARSVGFEALSFQYEPIAAALHHEQQIGHEERVLVADIGGGTSDFALVRVGPGRGAQADRREDILASHGVHVAGTDFDRRLALAVPMRALGHGHLGPAEGGGAAREVPARLFHDLATWHLVNLQYTPQRLAEARALRVNYEDARLHARLMTVLEDRLGHELLAVTEAAKIAVADGADTRLDLDLVERGLDAPLSAVQAREALQSDLARIVQAARETVRRAGVAESQVDGLYLTGGSTGWRGLVEALAAAFPAARLTQGDRLASVATGLGLHAQRLFGAA